MKNHSSALGKYRLILASRSPRRQQLLRELGIEFNVVLKDYDESYPEHLKGEEIASYIASAKAGSFRKDQKHRLPKSLRTGSRISSPVA